MLIDYSRADRELLKQALKLFIESTPPTRSDNLAAKILLSNLNKSMPNTSQHIDNTTIYTSPTAQDEYTPWLNYGDCL
jgi:hypothetical protein